MVLTIRGAWLGATMTLTRAVASRFGAIGSHRPYFCDAPAPTSDGGAGTRYHAF